MCHNVARHSYCTAALLQLSHRIAASQWICRALARDTRITNSYQSARRIDRPLRNPSQRLGHREQKRDSFQMARDIPPVTNIDITGAILQRLIGENAATMFESGGKSVRCEKLNAPYPSPQIIPRKHFHSLRCSRNRRRRAALIFFLRLFHFVQHWTSRSLFDRDRLRCDRLLFIR